MKLEQADISSLFSNTEIPDIFFTEYLSEAGGDHIKVYLYMLFLSKYDKDIKINDMSKKLVLPLKVIQDSVKYWEEKGVITKKNTGYILNSLQEINLHKLYKPRTALTPEQLQKSQDNQQRARAIEHINNKYFSGLMPTTWYPDIELWFQKYHFDEEVMIALFDYCFNRSAHRLGRAVHTLLNIITLPYRGVICNVQSAIITKNKRKLILLQILYLKNLDFIVHFQNTNMHMLKNGQLILPLLLILLKLH